MNLAPDSFLGRYRIVEKLGEGGMGVVWRALDTRLDREVALKLLPGRAAELPGRLQRFEREAKVVASLNHPNVVTLYSVEEARGVPFLTMELVRGQTLDRVTPTDGLPVPRFLEIAIALADALRAAHERGVVHRDLKPSNLMIDGEGRLKVLDFGLAKLTEESAPPTVEVSQAPTATVVTREERPMGTVPYMSPEQVQGRSLDARTDIFSTGVILHEMATGSRPFRGATMADVASSILRDTPSPVSEINFDYSDDLARIVARCLEKSADDRYASAERLRDDLRAAQAALERPRPSAAVRRIRTWILGSALILAAAAGVAFLRQTPAPRRGRPFSVAILPFANGTGDPAQDDRAAGIATALATQLGELRLVRVSAGLAELSDEDDRARRLSRARGKGIDALLEGEMHRAAGGVGIGARLVSTESGVVLHSQTLEGPPDELYRLQREIGRRFAGVLSVPISADEMRRLATNPTESFAAYDYFLQGHEQLRNGRGPAAMGMAIELLRQAIRSDDGFALAHADLSEALWRSFIDSGEGASLDEAEAEARRALALDPRLPSAMVALARIHSTRGRHTESIAELQRALVSHPNPAEAQRELGRTFRAAGDLERAEQCYRAAVALEDGDWFLWSELGSFLYGAGRYPEARAAWFAAAARAPPSVHMVEENLAGLAIMEGRYEEAIRTYEAIPGPIDSAARASNLATAYFFSDRADRWDQAERYYRTAVRLSPNNQGLHRNLADLYLKLGKVDLADEHFRQALNLVEKKLRVTPGNRTLRLQRAHYAARVGDCATALDIAGALAPELPRTATDLHDLAYAYALCGRRREALDALTDAVELGFSTAIVREEAEFESLAGDPEFERLTAPSGAPSRR